MPALAEPDVLRSLQALPEVTALNDLSAQLHVRGGGPDQNLFLFDGARVLSPYHLFGVFGAFNTDAVERVEFYRGGLPPRYGGALSSVVAIQTRSGAADGVRVDGGVSLLGARATVRGSLPWADGRWLVAGRRSYADLVLGPLYDEGFPYKVYDVQAGFEARPFPGQRVAASFLTTHDDVHVVLDPYDAHDLRSDWRNTVGSVRWDASAVAGWNLAAVLWGTGYHGSLGVGERGLEGAGQERTTLNDVGMAGFRVEASRQGQAAGVRAGLDLSGASAVLIGSAGPGAFVEGGATDGYVQPTVYAELERWLGPVRLAPGMRLGYEVGAGRWLLEPRISARYHMSDDWVLTAGLGRTTQILSTLRDDRYALPGAPLWFVHPAEAPAAATTGGSIELEGWVGDAWSFNLGGYYRRSGNVPVWRPVAHRTLDQIMYQHGTAHGLLASVRKHAGRITGWVGYGFGRATFEDGGGERYDASWDRPHSVDAAAFIRIWRQLKLSGRFMYGSGRPFWAPVGHHEMYRYDPLRGMAWTGGDYTIWAGTQARFPPTMRLDLGVRHTFEFRGAELEPSLSVLNVTAHQHPIDYRLGIRSGIQDPFYNGTFLPSRWPVPSLALDVRF